MHVVSRCLVLGGKGFIGSNLVRALGEAGHVVRSFDRPHLPARSTVAGRAIEVEELEGDFASDADIGQAVVGCDTCFHLVSTTLPKSSNLDPIFDVETNIMGTLRLLNHAVRAGLRKIIFVSSGGTVYGVPRSVPIEEGHPTDPICSYGITKLAIEKYLHLFQELHGLDYAVLRVSNPYGEQQRTNASQGAVAVFLGKALRGEQIEIWGDGSVVRDYVHISDVVSALAAAMSYAGKERIFNIGSGRGVSLNDLLNTIETAVGAAPRRVYTDKRSFDVPVSVLSIVRARREFGWAPEVRLQDGIARTVEWLRASGEF